MKNILKKFIAPMLVISLVLELSSGIVYAVENDSMIYEGIFRYEVHGEEIEIESVADKSITSIEIPETIDDKVVTSIGQGAFRECSRLTTATIPDSVYTIQQEAFYDCCNLSDVTFGDNIYSIGAYAFYGCESMQSLILPDSVFEIGDEAFFGCTNLVEVSIPGGLETAGLDILGHTAWLENQTDEYVVVGNGILLRCNSTQAVAKIPDGVRYLAGNSCSDTRAQTIQLPATVQTIGSMAFSGNAILENITIPDSVERIADYAFHECTALQRIILPDSVKTLGNQAFALCSGLKQVALSTSLTTIENSTFAGCTSLSDIYIPSGVKRIKNRAFNGCTALQKVTLPDTVTTVEKEVFRNCTALQQVIVKNSTCNILNMKNLVPSTTYLSGTEESTTDMYADIYDCYFIPIDGLPGDSNVSGVYDVTDAFTILQTATAISAGIDAAPEKKYFYRQDYTLNGQIDVTDAYGVLNEATRYSAGLER